MRTTIHVTKIFWKAKHGSKTRRMIILEGSCNLPGGSRFQRILIVHLRGARGCTLLVPIQRLECAHIEWVSQKSAIYQELDKEWMIDAESTIGINSEAELQKTIGRKGLSETGADTLEYLASWYPVVIDKRVFRSRDHLETTRIVCAENRAGRSIILKATKRAGHPETCNVQLLSKDGFSTFQELEKTLKYKICLPCIMEFPIIEAVDESGFHAALGAHAICLLSSDDYAHVVRGGIKPSVGATDDWQDGFDHGGTGLRPPPTGKAPPPPLPTPSSLSPSPIAPARPRTAPPRGTDHAAERARELAALEDDPRFGAF